ncbi:MAG: hypothetical protein B1H12_08510 [Desulfobacteraceae bacterium 4484_190.2]|nr:MAG: hypothetical protein B1H12_08510 [Desulfobacteraceae bacterium 4484_190.2]
MVNKATKDVIAYCVSCKMDLAHTVVAMDGETVKKVLCNTCNKEHVYRAPKGEKALTNKNKPVRKTRVKKIIDPDVLWEKALEPVQNLPSKLYTINGSFESGEKIDHKTFGLGLITKVIQPNKMEVIFKMGTKIMIRGN